jgi:hypothetical protein
VASLDLASGNGLMDLTNGSLTTAYAAMGDTNIDWSIDSLDAADFFAAGLYDAGNYNTAPDASGVAAVPEPAVPAGLALAVAAAVALRRRRGLWCALFALLAMPATSTYGEEAGFTSLFDGTTLAGWKASENVESWQVVDGAIVCQGPRSHLFYVGSDAEKPADFTNFHLKAEVMTRPNANAGIFFHTAFQQEGWPEVGYEMQVNNSFAKDPVRTGSIYNFVKVFTPAAADDVWFTQELLVKGKRITVSVDGKVLFEVVEPEGVTGTRKLSHGTFALQAHDPGSEARFRNLRVKRLP